MLNGAKKKMRKSERLKECKDVGSKHRKEKNRCVKTKVLRGKKNKPE